MMPTVFISHGAPNLELACPPAAQFLTELKQQIPRPESILCVSAHWETDQPTLGGAPRPDTIHDFYGFPDELYEMTYPAPGSPELAKRVQNLLATHNIATAIDLERGLDHGAWVPLRLLYPAADIPVVQLSVQPKLPPVHHMEIGQKLIPLREQGVLIMASGGATHNLRAFQNHRIDAKPLGQAAEFDDWLQQSITGGDDAALLQYLEYGPHATWNHPSAEHFLPLFIALGAAGSAAGQQLHKSFTFGVLSMAAYGWGM